MGLIGGNGGATGFRALGLGVVVLGIIGFKVFLRTPQYREIESGSMDVPTDKICVFSFEIRRACDVKFEITPTTNHFLGVYLISKSDYDRIERMINSGHDWTTDDVREYYHETGPGPFSLTDEHLQRGNYCFLIENFDDTHGRIDYRISTR